MVEITESKARSLVVSGEAGYWGIHHRTVVLEHDTQTVLRLRGKCWLAQVSEFKVTFMGEAGVLGGRAKGSFMIQTDSEQIERMACEEMAERSVTLDVDGHKVVNIPSDPSKFK